MLPGTCMACGGTHDVVLTVERDGFLRHYPACFEHIEVVVARLRLDVGGRQPIAAPKHGDAVNVESRDVRELPS